MSRVRCSPVAPAQPTDQPAPLTLVTGPEELLAERAVDEVKAQARRRELLRAHERLVLDSMSVDDAAAWLAKWQRWHATARRARCAGV